MQKKLTPDEYEARRLLLGYDGYDEFVHSYYNIITEIDASGVLTTQGLYEVDADTLQPLDDEERRERLSNALRSLMGPGQYKG